MSGTPKRNKTGDFEWITSSVQKNVYSYLFDVSTTSFDSSHRIQLLRLILLTEFVDQKSWRISEVSVL